MNTEEQLSKTAIASETPSAVGPANLPIFLSLRGKRVLVVGGGPVAASKVETLLSVGAAVTLVAPAIVPEAERPGVAIRRRRFREQDLDGVWLVIAAAPTAVNANVARAAARRRLFVNAVDDPRNASAIFGGVIRRGAVTLAISSGGNAPGLVRLLREALNDVLPQELTVWVEMARAERQKWLRERTKVAERVPLLAAAISRLYARPQAVNDCHDGQ